MFESGGLWAEDFSGWAIAHPQIGFFGAAMSAFAAVFDPASSIFAAHACDEIGEMEPGTSDRDGDRVCGVEAEEPDAGFAAVRDIGAHVEFGECGERRQRRRGAQAHARHAEGNHADPGFALKRVDFEWGGDEWTQSRNIDSPVREEQIVPGLRHDPRTRRDRPWAMCDFG